MLRLSQLLSLVILFFITQKVFFAGNKPFVEPPIQETIIPTIEQKAIVEQKTEIIAISETAAITVKKAPRLQKSTAQPKEESIQETEQEPVIPTDAEPELVDCAPPRLVAEEESEPKIITIVCPNWNVKHAELIKEPIKEIQKQEQLVPIMKALDAPESIECRVYPNPATEYITVELSDAAEATMNLVSSNGQLVWSGITQDQTTVVDLQNYPAGVYYLQVVSGTQKMVKSVVVQ